MSNLESSWIAVAQSTAGGGGVGARDGLTDDVPNLRPPDATRRSVVGSTIFMADACVGDEYAPVRGFLGAVTTGTG